ASARHSCTESSPGGIGRDSLVRAVWATGRRTQDFRPTSKPGSLVLVLVWQLHPAAVRLHAVESSEARAHDRRMARLTRIARPSGASVAHELNGYLEPWRSAAA